MALFILDATVLSNFARAGRLDLLPLAVGGHLATCPGVMQEIAAGQSLGHLPSSDWSWLRVLALTDAEEHLAAAHLTRLDRGEAECLALAQTRGGVVCTDDLAARRIVRSLGLSVSGTLGILLVLVRRGFLAAAEGNDLLEVMVEAGYRAPVATVSELLGPGAQGHCGGPSSQAAAAPSENEP